jgi:tRNA dimethylallyltransferase
MQTSTKNSNERTVVFIVGPTASGKTEIAIDLARRVNGEILSADSRQIYKHLTIGTAKPSAAQLQEIKHWFIDLLDPQQSYSAGEFGQQARERIDDIFSRGKQPIVAGGSGLYIKAIIEGFFENDVKSEKVRAALKNRLKMEGNKPLYDDLMRLDPKGAAQINVNDTQRLLRYMEVFLITGKSLLDMQQNKINPPSFKVLQYGLAMPREVLYERINKRVELMVEGGLMAEVADIRVMGNSEDLNALNTVGYKEVFQYFSGEFSFEDMVEKIKTNTRRYAKRQMTWFKSDNTIYWCDIHAEDGRNKLLSTIENDLQNDSV